MFKSIVCFFSLLLFFASCTRNQTGEFTQYYEDGMAKPVVIVAPIIDSTSYDIPWSLSEEFTTLIINHLARTGKVFIPKEADLQNQVTHSPFGNDVDWIKNQYANTEFVVFLELVQHEDIPVQRKYKKIDLQDVSYDLRMSIRVRAFDLRGQKPKVILQEIVSDTYYVPKTILHTDYNYATWGTEEYQTSAMNIAHHQLVKQISRRISDYILLAKSR